MKSPEQIRKIVTKEVDESIEQLFKNIHAKAQTESGDMTLEQTLRLYEIKTNLFGLIVEQVESNLSVR